jgi:hypothetical protein
MRLHVLVCSLNLSCLKNDVEVVMLWYHRKKEAIVCWKV